MTNLYEIVEFCATAYHSVTHSSSVDGGVGTNLIVALKDNIAYLRDLLIFAVHRSEAEAVCTYHTSSMKYCVIANHTVVIDFRTSIDNTVLAHLDVLAEIDLRVNLRTFADGHALGNIGKGTHICIGWDAHRSVDIRRLFDALFLWIEGSLHHIEQHTHSGTGISHLDQCCLYFSFHLNRLVDKHYRRLG